MFHNYKSDNRANDRSDNRANNEVYRNNELIEIVVIMIITTAVIRILLVLRGQTYAIETTVVSEVKAKGIEVKSEVVVSSNVVGNKDDKPS